MALEIREQLPAPDRLDSATEFFSMAAVEIQRGYVNELDLATLNTDNFSGRDYFFTGLMSRYGNPNGADLSEAAIRRALPEFINFLTGEFPGQDHAEGGWGILEDITRDEPPDRTATESHYNVSRWYLDTEHPGIMVGIRKVWDDHGVWSRTWFLSKSPMTDEPASLKDRISGRLRRFFTGGE
ncbi:hypothetical protein A2Z33_02195 [Candidatus Gottesmanbacteria bacterium RBG_16_52_11]|uniref:Uncharacterized protein n=1 Tax=Candidatus Gottesmanbacteria bacterium RBG_16_52_11 TaxID=1798374 RepID=A0A1F5YQV7_9BACT|nr:MAG: hypothetical protein A2Z33_02195 [Candidatus Gottesmanbacteria bacterium RBG_16_52_11]